MLYVVQKEIYLTVMFQNSITVNKSIPLNNCKVSL